MLTGDRLSSSKLKFVFSHFTSDTKFFLLRTMLHKYSYMIWIIGRFMKLYEVSTLIIVGGFETYFLNMSLFIAIIACIIDMEVFIRQVRFAATTKTFNLFLRFCLRCIVLLVIGRVFFLRFSSFSWICGVFVLPQPAFGFRIRLWLITPWLWLLSGRLLILYSLILGDDLVLFDFLNKK